MQTVFASLRHKAEGRNDKVIFCLDGKKFYNGGFNSFLFFTF